MRRSQKGRTVRRRSSSLRRRLRNSARTTRPYRRKSSSKRRRYRRSNNRRSNTNRKRSNKRSNGRRRRSNNRMKKTNKKRRRIVGGAPLFGQGPGGLLKAIQDQAQEEGETKGVEKGVNDTVQKYVDKLTEPTVAGATSAAAVISAIQDLGVIIKTGGTGSGSGGTVAAPAVVVVTPPPAPKPTDTAGVYRRIVDIFNGQSEGVGFTATVTTFADKYLGPADSTALQAWMGNYLTDPTRILTKKNASTETGGGNYFNFTVATPDAPGPNFGNYIDARAILQKTIKDPGTVSEFEPLGQFATLQSATGLTGEAEVKDIINNRLDAMMGAVQRKLLEYLPDDTVDIYPMPSHVEVVRAFTDILSHVDIIGCMGLANADRGRRIERRVKQIIGALYLESWNPSSDEIWEAFHNPDMGNPVEIAAFLDATNDKFSPDHGTADDVNQPRAVPDHATPAGGIDRYNIFGHDHCPSLVKFLDRLALPDAAGKDAFKLFMNGSIGAVVDDADDGGGSRLNVLRADATTQGLATDDEKRHGFIFYLREMLTKFICEQADCGDKILKKIIAAFSLNSGSKSLDDKKDEVGAFLAKVDECRSPGGTTFDAVADFYGTSFAANAAILTAAKDRSVFFPVNETGLGKPDLLATLTKLYDGADIDPSDFPAIATGAVAGPEALAFREKLSHYSLGEDPVKADDMDKTKWTT